MLNRDVCVKCFEKWYHEHHEFILGWAEVNAPKSLVVHNYKEAVEDFIHNFDAGIFKCEHRGHAFLWSTESSPPETCPYALEHIVSDEEVIEPC
jgi:hypothetical protein